MRGAAMIARLHGRLLEKAARADRRRRRRRRLPAFGVAAVVLPPAGARGRGRSARPYPRPRGRAAALRLPRRGRARAFPAADPGGHRRPAGGDGRALGARGGRARTRARRGGRAAPDGDSRHRQEEGRPHDPAAAREGPLAAGRCGRPSPARRRGDGAEAVSALVNLGYKPAEAERAVQHAAAAGSTPLPELIREALRRLAS